jgi:hypothetical protein
MSKKHVVVSIGYNANNFIVGGSITVDPQYDRFFNEIRNMSMPEDVQWGSIHLAALLDAGFEIVHVSSNGGSVAAGVFTITTFVLRSP